MIVKYNMHFSPNKTPIEVIKEAALVVLILATFVLALIKNVQKFMERICSVKKY